MNADEISIDLGGYNLKADLYVPANAKGTIIFSHGSGSSRKSHRNRSMADYLNRAGFATLLTDLLTSDEDQLFENRFDIDLLTGRLIRITQWVMDNPQTKVLSAGYFGASTGAASALRSAAFFGDMIRCVVSRGGRPDLAMESLEKVKSPTLLIVGGSDMEVIEMNKTAYEHLLSPKDMRIIDGATHLFEEPGALEQVERLAADWFNQYLV